MSLRCKDLAKDGLLEGFTDHGTSLSVVRPSEDVIDDAEDNRGRTYPES
jgi:hypothetical protein